MRFDSHTPYGILTVLIFIRHMAPLPPHDQRHLWLRYQLSGYANEIVHDFKQRLKTIFDGQVNRVHILDFKGLTPDARVGSNMELDVANTLCFQLGGSRCNMTWRQFILDLGLHTAEEMVEDRFGAYWLGSERVIPDKGDLSDYWVEISSGRDFLRGAPSYIYIKVLVRRLCHRLISYSIFRRGQAPKKVSGARLSRGHFIRRLAYYFGLVSDDGLRGLLVMARELSLIDMGDLVKLNIYIEIVDKGAQADPAPVQALQLPPPLPTASRTMPQRLGILEEEIQGLCRDVKSLCGLVESSMTDQGRVSTWLISCMTQLMEANG
nr:hypothetical protein [Tanacetum cinerariifolium]